VLTQGYKKKGREKRIVKGQLISPFICAGEKQEEDLDFL
jgi:hypothetical protein